MGVFLQSAVEAPRVHETSWMVYTALSIQNAIWYRFERLNFTKKLFSLYTRYIIFEGGVGGQKNLNFFLFCIFLDFCLKRNTNSPGEVNFSEKRFFWATLISNLYRLNSKTLIQRYSPICLVSTLMPIGRIGIFWLTLIHYDTLLMNFD